jgi:hypothetical protein
MRGHGVPGDQDVEGVKIAGTRTRDGYRIVHVVDSIQSRAGSPFEVPPG